MNRITRATHCERALRSSASEHLVSQITQARHRFGMPGPSGTQRYRATVVEQVNFPENGASHCFQRLPIDIPMLVIYC